MKICTLVKYTKMETELTQKCTRRRNTVLFYYFTISSSFSTSKMIKRNTSVIFSANKLWTIKNVKILCVYYRMLCKVQNQFSLQAIHGASVQKNWHFSLPIKNVIYCRSINTDKKKVSGIIHKQSNSHTLNISHCFTDQLKFHL